MTAPLTQNSAIHGGEVVSFTLGESILGIQMGPRDVLDDMEDIILAPA